MELRKRVRTILGPCWICTNAHDFPFECDIRGSISIMPQP